MKSRCFGLIFKCKKLGLEGGEVVHLKSYGLLSDGTGIRSMILQIVDYTLWYLIFLHL